MKCLCGEELCHDSDEEGENLGLDPDEWAMVSFLHCIHCGIALELYVPQTKQLGACHER